MSLNIGARPVRSLKLLTGLDTNTGSLTIHTISNICFMKIAKILLAVAVIGAIMAPFAFAADVPEIPPGPQNYDELLAIVNTILGWLFAILLIMSAVVILMAAYTYVTSKGDPAKIKEATNMIVYAAIGLIIALLSNVLRNIIPTVLS